MIYEIFATISLASFLDFACIFYHAFLFCLVFFFALFSLDFGGVAQLVEQLTLNQWVQSSSLCTSTIFYFFASFFAFLDVTFLMIFAFGFFVFFLFLDELFDFENFAKIMRNLITQKGTK